MIDRKARWNASGWSGAPLLARRQFHAKTQGVLDALLVAGALLAAYWLRGLLGHSLLNRSHPFTVDMLWYLGVAPIAPYALSLVGLYDHGVALPAGRALWLIWKGLGVCLIIIMVSAFVFRERVDFMSRVLLVIFFMTAVAAIWLRHVAWRRLSLASSLPVATLVIIGGAAENTEFAELFAANPEWRMKLAAALDITHEDSMGRLERLLHDEPIDSLIVTTARAPLDKIEAAVRMCETEGVDVLVLADFVRPHVARTSLDEFHGRPVLVLRSKPNLPWALMIKRGIDVVGAVVGLIVLGPLVLLPAALAIRLTSRGPVLFRQTRSGLHGRRFTMYKLRTMVDDAEAKRRELEASNEQTGPAFKMARDPRVTPVGRFLRRSSIDELPQLVNVLLGDMSLVGPRPPIPAEVERYLAWQRRRLSMRPGLTCLWQVRGRNRIPFERWMELDLEYIDRWSLLLDAEILARTVPAVLSGDGAS